MQTRTRNPITTIHTESVLLPLDLPQRVRKASKVRNVQYRVEPQLPPDVLGIYVYLPKNQS